MSSVVQGSQSTSESSHKHVKNYTILKGHKGSVNCLEVNSNDDTLFSGSEDGTVRVWDLRLSKCVKAILTPKQNVDEIESINSLACLNDTIFVSQGDKIFSYDFRRPEILLKEYKWDFKNNDEINQISIDEAGKYLLLCDDNCEIKIIQLDTMKVIKVLKKHLDACITAKFRPKFNELLSGGFDCNVLQWEYMKSRLNSVYQHSMQSNSSNNIVNPPYVHSLDMHKDGNFSCVGYGDGSIEIINLYSKSSSCKIESAHSSAVCQVIFSKFSDYKHIISAGNDKMIKIWNTQFPHFEDMKKYVSMKNELELLSHSGKKKLTKAMIAKSKKRVADLTEMMNNLDIQTNYSLAVNINHNEKVNWLQTTKQTTPIGNLFVGDVSNNIGCYHIEL